MAKTSGRGGAKLRDVVRAGESGCPTSQDRDIGQPGIVVGEVPATIKALSPPVPCGTRTGHTDFVGGSSGSAGLVLRRAPRPSGCSRFVRREIADAMPSICAVLLTRVIGEGDLASLKLLLQMAAGGQSAEAEGTRRSTGFGRKILVGFKDFEARENGMRRES